MSSVSQVEKKTQQHAVKLFQQQLGYDYLGDWAERLNNANIESERLDDLDRLLFMHTKHYAG